MVARTQYQYANYSANYVYWGKGSIRLQLINQRSDFSFALFTGGLHNVRMLASCTTGKAGRLDRSICVSAHRPALHPSHILGSPS